MDDTAIVGENIEIVNADDGPLSAISWSAAIAGAITAIAVSFLIIALGTGAGLAVASPYSGPSAATLTIAGAIWLVLAQTCGFASGGFVAARLRADRIAVTRDEGRFRDGAHGFIAWAIGVLAVSVLLFGAAANTARTAAVASSASAATSAPIGNSSVTGAITDPNGYYVDELLRADPARQAGNASPQSNTAMRDQVARILAVSVAEGNLSGDDRTYLAQVVASRAGLSNDDAQKRVDDVFNRALTNTRETADKALKAGAYLSFWTFMSLLFGAVAAALGGIMGGEHREDSTLVRRSVAR